MNDETITQSRSETHGEDMRTGAGGADQKRAEPDLAKSGNLQIVHCCDCWHYTDDMNREVALANTAAHIVVNSTPASEQTEAYKSAVSFLAAKFQPGPESRSFKRLELDQFRLG